MSPVSWSDIFTLLLRGDRIMELRHQEARALPELRAWGKLHRKWRKLLPWSVARSPTTPCWKNLVAEVWALSIRPKTRALAGMWHLSFFLNISPEALKRSRDSVARRARPPP